MAQLHEHPDGWIYVRTPSGTYVDTRANFIADFRWQIPAKPEGCVERLYDDEGRHVLADAKGNHRHEGLVPWEWADRAIAQIATLLERQRARQQEAQAAWVAQDAAQAQAMSAASIAAWHAANPLPPAPVPGAPVSSSPTNVKTF